MNNEENTNLEKVIRQKRELKKKKGEVCVYCGCTNRMILTIDHKIPLSRGGEDTDKNKSVCCYPCNQLKGSLTSTEFKKYQKALYQMYDLYKLSMKMIIQPLEFKPFHYPEFDKIVEPATPQEETE